MADRKIKLLIQSDDIVLGNTYLGLKFNNTGLPSSKIENPRLGVVCEIMPTSEQLANNNELNKIEVSLINIISQGTINVFQINSAEDLIDNYSAEVDKTNITNVVLTEADFGTKIKLSFADGTIIPSTNNARGTSFKKLGTTKDVLMGTSTTSYSIFAYDKNKQFKYFIFNNTSYSEPKYYKFTSDIEYIVIGGGTSEVKCPLGTIIYNVPIDYVYYNIRVLQELEACPYKVFTYEEFFNTKNTRIETYVSEPSSSDTNDARIKLDVRDYIGIQTSNRGLCPLFEYDKEGNCINAYTYQSNSDNWYVRGAIRFSPETAYITVSCNKSYKTNIVLYKKPSSRSYVSAIDNEKYSRNSRMSEWNIFGDSTSDEGWAGNEVDYWTMASRILGLQATNMAKAASSFLPFKGSGSVAGKSNTAIYDKTKLLSDFKGLITILGGTNDYNGGWDGSVWGAAKTEDTVTKLMSTQENGKELFRELSVKKFEELLTIEELLADHNNHYFEEAFMYTMWDLKIRNPKALIICISPFGRIGEEYPNIVGATLQDYRDTERRICQLLGIPFLDVQDVVGGINYTFYFNAAESETSAAEGLHPNKDGHKFTSAWLSVKLREYIDMWELLNNGYIDTAYEQGKNTTTQSNKMFAKENFELKDYVVY